MLIPYHCRRESSSVSSTSSVAMSQVSSRISHSPVTESSPATPPESPLEDDSKKEMESRLQSSNDNQVGREMPFYSF